MEEVKEAFGTAFQEELAAKILNDCSESTKHDFEKMRQALAEATDAVDQERRSRTDALTKVQDDANAAVLKESEERQQEIKSLRLHIVDEAQSRQEIVEVIQQAIEDLREGLET